ncbi:MAG: enzyme family protein [Caulobacteraceae bacterium]|nr:enzyme family protein [Caulobacteraceae bacterium]
MTIADVAQGQLDAYNAQDLDWYCSYFTDDVIVADVGGQVTGQGIEAYRTRYQGAFAKFPGNKAQLLNRIVLGQTVIDHERVDRGDGETAPFEVAAVYSFRGDKIARVDFAK